MASHRLEVPCSGSRSRAVSPVALRRVRVVTNAAITLSDAHGAAYADMLREVAETRGVEPAQLTTFWPMVGHAYSGALLVAGRRRRGGSRRPRCAGVSRSCREAHERGRPRLPDGLGHRAMGRSRRRLQQRRSLFWRHVRSALAALDPESNADPAWSGRVANPGGALLGGPASRGLQAARARWRSCATAAGGELFDVRPRCVGAGVRHDQRRGGIGLGPRPPERSEPERTRRSRARLRRVQPTPEPRPPGRGSDYLVLQRP